MTLPSRSARDHLYAYQPDSLGQPSSCGCEQATAMISRLRPRSENPSFLIDSPTHTRHPLPMTRPREALPPLGEDSFSEKALFLHVPTQHAAWPRSLPCFLGLQCLSKISMHPGPSRTFCRWQREREADLSKVTQHVSQEGHSSSLHPSRCVHITLNALHSKPSLHWWGTGPL